MKRFVQSDNHRQSFLLPERFTLTSLTPIRCARIVDVFVDELDLGELGFEGVEPALTGRPCVSPGGVQLNLDFFDLDPEQITCQLCALLRQNQVGPGTRVSTISRPRRRFARRPLLCRHVQRVTH